jgi:hypothetical protein
MAEHAMPAGIKRIGKGVYRTLDDRHEIRQEEKGWEVTELASGQRVGEPFKNRGLAVQALADAGKLPTEAPKPEPEQPKAEEPKAETEPGPKAKHPEIDAKGDYKGGARRPTGRRPRQKATASA